MRCDICNEHLKDYEWKYGDGTCNTCLSIIESCVQDDFSEEHFSQFEDHYEGVREVFDLNFYDNLDYFNDSYEDN